MGKVTRRTRLNSKLPKGERMGSVIFKGVAVSAVVSLLCLLFLSFLSLTTDNTFVDQYIRYIMVAITMISIFIGSVYAAQKINSKGLIVGIAVAVIYVLVTIGFGLKVSREPIELLLILNKFVAGLAAGALGGLIGVNL